MPNSKFIAGLIGPTLLALGASILINHAHLSTIAIDIARDGGLILLSGLILMVTGLAILQSHRTWSGWPAIITALGWLALLGGLIRVLAFSAAPEMVQTAGFGTEMLTTAGVVLAAAGAFLTFKAYFSEA